MLVSAELCECEADVGVATEEALKDSTRWERLRLGRCVSRAVQTTGRGEVPRVGEAERSCETGGNHTASHVFTAELGDFARVLCIGSLCCR